MDISHGFLEEILDSISEGLYTIDKKCKINFFNSAAEKILGYKREEILGKLCKNVFGSKHCLHQCPIVHILKNEQNVYDFNTKYKHKSGKLIDVRLNAVLMHNDSGELIGGVVSFRELNELEVIKNTLKKSSDFYGIIGHNKTMREIFQLVRDISDTDATVFLYGESGTGKEMLANAIQTISKRKNAPFVKMNCSVFPPQLLASELFGHVKGAFTDAVQDRKGRFEMANGGTIFLDEVAEMTLQMQLQLLRVLQEGTFERIGESVTRYIDVRVIAATNKNLKKAITEGKFREDLYYRLNVIPIEIPPLRERKDDLPHLIKYFIKKFEYIYKKNLHEIEDNAMDMLLSYNWPGNVRELENAIEYAFVRSKNTSIIKTQKLPPVIRDSFKVLNTQNNNTNTSELLTLLKKHHWNKRKVAEELGISRTTLWRKLKAVDIE